LGSTDILAELAKPGAYIARFLASSKFFLHLNGVAAALPEAMCNSLERQGYMQAVASKQDNPEAAEIFRITAKGRAALATIPTPQT
jgi:hypothetical protein